MEHTISQLIRDRNSPSSETPPPTRTLPEKLGDFFEEFHSNGPEWNAHERLFAFLMLEEAEKAAAIMLHQDPGYSISFLGQTSAGKTMMARLLRRFWNKHAPPRKNGTTMHFCDFIRWPEHNWEDLETERNSPCIVLDEVGRGERGKNGAEWTRFLSFFNFRQERGLWTIITSNLSWEEIRAIDPAVASRMRRHNGVILQAGPEIRPFEDRKP